jgi:hypothetical protein
MSRLVSVMFRSQAGGAAGVYGDPLFRAGRRTGAREPLSANPRARQCVFSGLGNLTVRNLVAAPWLSSSRQTLLSIVVAVVVVVFSLLALLKVNSSAKQAPAKELFTRSIPRSPTVRKSPSNDSMAAFLALDSIQPATQFMQSTLVDRAAVPLPRPRPKRL